MTTETTPQRDTRPVTVPFWALERFVSHAAGDDHWNHADDPVLGQAFNELAAAKDAALGREPAAPAAAPEPELPPGEFATVEIMGHDQETGWVTDGTRAGVPVLVIRGHDGRVIREVPGHSVFTYIPLPTPLRRPDPEPLAALPAGAHEGWYGGEDDDEPADAFAGSVDPDAAF